MIKGNIVEYDGKNYISVDENSAEEVYNNKCFIVIAAGKENDKNLSLELIKSSYIRFEGRDFEQVKEDVELSTGGRTVAYLIPIN